MGLNKSSISFVGGGYEDILMYLIYCLKNLGISVLVRDRTKEHRFYDIMPHIEGLDPGKEVLDLVWAHYTFGNGYEDHSLTIDIFDHDGVPDADSLLIAVTDEHIWHEEAMEKSSFSSGDVFIIRDYTGAVKKQYEEFVQKKAFKEVYAVPLSLKDIKTRILTEYRKVKGFSGVSDELCEVVRALLNIIAEDRPEKDIKRAYKRGKRGNLQ